MKLLALGLIRLYQLLVSPLFPPACRFWPTCSHYSYEVIANHGVLRGGWLSLRRFCRCHPFHPGGYDPPVTNSRAPVAWPTVDRARPSDPLLQEERLGSSGSPDFRASALELRPRLGAS